MKNKTYSLIEKTNEVNGKRKYEKENYKKEKQRDSINSNEMYFVLPEKSIKIYNL